MTRRRRNSWRVPLDGDDLRRVAERVFDGHHLFAEGGAFRERQSGVWRRRDGTFTVLLVYEDGERKVFVRHAGIRPRR